MNYDNPAARLLALLVAGKAIPPDTQCRAAWQSVLQTNGQESLLVSRIGKAMELPQAAIEALRESFPEETPTWQHWEGQIGAAFYHQHLNSAWKTFIDHIDQHTITYLQMSATLLQSKSNVGLIAGAELDATRETLQELIAALLVSDQPEEVKKYLVRQLRKIVVAIEEYRLTGAFPILDAVEGAFGHSLVDAHYSNFLKNDSLGQRVVTCLAAAANLVTVVTGLPNLPGTAALLLSLAK